MAIEIGKNNAQDIETARALGAANEAAKDEYLNAVNTGTDAELAAATVKNNKASERFTAFMNMAKADHDSKMQVLNQLRV